MFKLCLIIFLYRLSCLVANLQMKVTWLRMKSQVNSVSVVTDDVFGSRILAVASSYELLQSNKCHQNQLADIMLGSISFPRVLLFLFLFIFYTLDEA